MRPCFSGKHMGVCQSTLTKVFMMGCIQTARMSRLGSILVVLVGFAMLNSIFALLNLTTNSLPPIVQQGLLGSPSISPSPFFLATIATFLSIHSFVLAPSSWLLVVGVWVWRGRLKSRWEGLGFDSDVFRLFMRMRGGKSRVRMLNALGQPKDRHQLAQELGMDWRGVDQHIAALSRHGLVSDEVAYGKVIMYRLTPSGKALLQLLEDMDAEVGKTPRIGQMN